MKLSKSLLLSTLVMGALAAYPLYAKETTESSARMTPTEIATLATVATLDKNEILAGVVASNKKVNSDVKNFAQMMIDQHGSNLTQILEMVNNAYTLTSDEADKLSAEGKKGLMKLGALKDSEFAKAYVDAMVKGHEAALNLIDQQLMKTAKSEELKKFMTSTRAAVATHLEHAKNLQAKM
ncbi:MAG TPA: DUF4142 domain-containing protein [Gammaproteobacteria bacterium]|nr:DUF4142 domain-containing protein [Gammaproteobacteria bacterium]